MDSSEKNLFDGYFESINLNEDLKEFYDFLNDNKLNNSFVEETKLIELRNDNYKRYNDISIIQISNLSDDLDNIVNEIKKIYDLFVCEKLLTETKKEAENTKQLLDVIYKNLGDLEYKVRENLNILENENDRKQREIKNTNFNNVDRKILKQFTNEYNNIVLYNSTIEDNIYDNYRLQLKRKKDLDKIFKLISVEISNIEDDEISKKLELEIQKINDRIMFLEDLIPNNSNFKNDLNSFKSYFYSLIAYDDKNDYQIKKLYNYLKNNPKVNDLLNYIEDRLIDEVEKNRYEEQFIYEKQGIKNLKISLDYTSANYMNLLESYEKDVINYLYDQLDESICNVDTLYNNFKNIIFNIWNKSITDVYAYDENEDFYFIGCNNQFLDEKHESILLTNKTIKNYEICSNYSIGFICNYNKNILYITENEDIMDVRYNDMSNLKTPKQIEQELLNFDVLNKIALDGYTTKIEAVYLIYDKDLVKYKKAVQLANQYQLPLIVLKKR